MNQQKNAQSMTSLERRAALSLAGIFSMRMLGLFMIYPVFAVYAQGLPDATPARIGLALGIYGLAQACLQIPFGLLSDKIGRRSVITFGLLLFALGSVLAALAHSIDGIILGRLLQGTGAVGSVVLALTADLTRDEHRTKAMAIIGMTIGMSFGVAVVLGPVLNNLIAVPGIFWLTSILAFVGIIILHTLVPRPRIKRLHRDTEAVPALMKRVLADGQLLRLDFGIFAQHAILTAMFLALPVALKEHASLHMKHQWALYLPVLVLSVMAMVPFIIYGEKRAKMKAVFIGGIAALGGAQFILLFWHASLWTIVPALLVFFTAFNLLEASLPSLISRLAPAGLKGTALGVYSSSQFFGIFVGGAIGGWLNGHFGLGGAFGFSLALAVVWLMVAMGMRNPGYMSNRIVPIGAGVELDETALSARLNALPGVLEAVVAIDEGLVYLKVDKLKIDEAQLQNIIAA